MLRKILLIFVCGIVFLIQSCNLSDATKNLGEGYFYRNEGSEIKDILCEQPEGGFIPSTILNFKYNKDFIVAKQKPKIPQDPLYDLNIKYGNGTDGIYYWIIIKKENLVLGPLELDEFKKEANKYDVPSKMTLK